MGSWWLALSTMVAMTPQTGNADLDAFLADVAAGRRDPALARILEMNSISGRPNAVAFADEFVDKLLHCTFVSSEVRDFAGAMYDLMWRCPDGDYYSLLDPNYRPPRIVVGEFVSAAERDRRRRNRSVPAPSPAPTARMAEPSAEERRRIVVRYLEALRHGASIPPSPSTFLVRFADGRPNSFIGAEQLRRILAPCRQAGVESRETGGTIVHWTCAGRGALNPNITTLFGVSGDRVAGGFAWIGPLPRVPTIASPH